MHRKQFLSELQALRARTVTQVELLRLFHAIYRRGYKAGWRTGQKGHPMDAWVTAA